VTTEGRVTVGKHVRNVAAPLLLAAATLFAAVPAAGQVSRTVPAPAPVPDSAVNVKRNALGLLLSISGDGFGVGGMYRREFTEDLYGFATLSVSGAKDDREVEFIDPYTGSSYTPGKLTRFLVVPMYFGIERRLFREEILDNFRPYLNVGVGPAMIYASPYTDIIYNEDGSIADYRPVDFFESLGRGQAYWTVTAAIGAGAFFGSDRSSLMGLHVSYTFTYLFDEGIPSLYDPTTGAVAGTKKSFGGLVITLTIGTSY